MRSKENYKDGERDGLSEFYHTNGQLGKRSNYKKGEIDGLREVYYSNGKKMFKGNYKKGNSDGLPKWYDENGQMTAPEKLGGTLVNMPLFMDEL